MASENFAANTGDEYLSLDRSNGFLIKGDFLTVYMGNMPNFHKPPLQYWINAIQIHSGVEPFFATRLTSFVFAILLLLNVVFLVWLLLPDQPLALVIAPLPLATSENFWRYSVSAMLDIGAAFFAVFAITMLIVSLRRPVCWYLWAVVVAMGALQKVPVGLLFSAAILFVLFIQHRHDPEESARFQDNKHFRYSCLLLVILLLFWPAVQLLRHGFEAVKTLVFDQMLDRFSPNILEIDNSQFVWLNWILGDEVVLWVSGILASLIILFNKNRDLTFGIAVCVLLFFLAMSLANGRVFPRYLLIIYPLTTVLLVIFLFKTFRNPLISTSILLALLLVGGNPVHSEASIMKMSDVRNNFENIFVDIRSTLNEDDNLLICPGRTRPYPSAGAVSFHALNKARLVKIRRYRDIHKRMKRFKVHDNYNGLCHKKHEEQLRSLFTDFEILSTESNFIFWTASALKEAGSTR